MYRIKKIFNPEVFQGKHKKTNYFEGWYYKIIDSKMENIYAIIPGVSLDEKTNDTHAFIQVLDAHSKEVNYFRYAIVSSQAKCTFFRHKVYTSISLV